MYLRAKFHLALLNRLATIHHLQTDRTDRTGQTGERSDSIGRTVLQTVSPKSCFFECLSFLHKFHKTCMINADKAVVIKYELFTRNCNFVRHFVPVCLCDRAWIC